MYHGMSTSQGKPEIKKFLLEHLKPGDKILDVGAGRGTYHDLLGNDFNWSAVEVWHPTAQYLLSKYNKVYEGSIVDFYYLEDYDLVIFGDVIEHLEVEDAQKVIKHAKEHSKAILIALPYDNEQGPINGNQAEIHRQTKMTPEIFDERYPGFKLILDYKVHAYYYWEREVKE